jgi:hypothetical protein
MRFPLIVCVFVCFAVMTIPSFGQSPNGNINGLISDPSSAAVVGAEIVAVNDVTGVLYTTKTNSEGIYVLANLPPGPYRVQVSKVGFKTLIKPDIVLNVQDSLSINFTLLVGAFHEIVTVEGGAPLVNTESAAVSTVVDRQFAENLPMNGRSFQTLIELTPGIVATTSSTFDSGQFSINGQRASSNYWMVDGVSANVGISPFSSPGNGFGGTLGSFSALGGTNSLVSVDAMQEFRIQTSTFAPEFGRTPGGQISIATRSGANRFHGTLFDYFRNDVLDAENWFNGFTNNPPLPKAEERQNDFGGTFNGPILKDRTFFFFSYEGLRLRLPQTELTTVPDLNARMNAIPVLQPYLNAYPRPNGPDLGQGIAEFNASFSNAASLDAYSLRLDHRLNGKLSLFGRYNYSPSQLVDRGSNGTAALSDVFPSNITTQTATVGASWLISQTAMNDLRFNYSRTRADSYYYMDNLGGASPLVSPPFPSGFTTSNSNFAFEPFSLSSGAELTVGKNASNLQEQVNLVENLSLQKGSHGLKFGVDFRRLSPLRDPVVYVQQAFFLDVPSAETGNLLESAVSSGLSARLLFRNLGAFAQDTWRMFPRLTLTYGLRWDVDFAPSSLSGPNFLAVTGYNLNNLANLALAPAGTPPYKTRYANLAPRIGAAFLLSQSRNFETVLRGGFGVFFDLPSSEAGTLASLASYPFGALNVNFGGTFPLDSVSAQPPAITPAYLSSAFGTVGAFDPHLQLPYTLEWNVSLEQAVGQQQSLTATYVGSSGRRLIQSAYVIAPNPNFGNAYLVGNSADSSYNALQLQFQRRLSHGLQAVASYTFSHSIDTASAGSVFGNATNSAVPGVNAASNRGSSDFDLRHAFSAGLTFEVPFHRASRIANAILGGWSAETFILVHSATPVTASDVEFSTLLNGYTTIRPDVVAGTPLYVYGSQCVAVFGVTCPGGKGFNPAAFTNPPIDPVTGLPLRQGTLPRNALRGFAAAQWDFALHRDLPIHEDWKIQFRAETFNILNHPNFGPPNAGFGAGSFGLATQMLGQSLNGNNVGGGALSPLYQLGGPRSVQLALKLMF